MLVLVNGIIFNENQASHLCEGHKVLFCLSHHLHFNSTGLFTECLLCHWHVFGWEKYKADSRQLLEHGGHREHSFAEAITSY